MDSVEDLALLVQFWRSRIAEDKGARDVGLVAFDETAIVDKDDLSLANDLRIERSMRKRRIFPHLATGLTHTTATSVSHIDELRELASSHAGLRRLVRRRVNRQRNVVSKLHQSQLRGSLDAAAAKGDGYSANGGERRACVGDAIGENKLRTLLHTDLPRRDAGIFESFGEQPVRIFVFVPGVNASSRSRWKSSRLGLHALAHATLFEDGADDERCAHSGENPRKEAFGLAPAQAGEVAKRSSSGDDKRINMVLMQKCASPFKSLLTLSKCDRQRFGAAARECGNGGRKVVRLSRLTGEGKGGHRYGSGC